MIALNMIVKGSKSEAKLLDQCLETVAPHVDGIFLTLTHKKGATVHKEVIKVANKYNANISEFEWVNHFGKARTHALEQVSSEFEWVLWCDADDVLEGGENIKKVLANTNPDIGAVFVKYEYNHDEFGNVTEEQWLPRLFRNDGTWTWSDAQIHETPLERRMNTKVKTDDFYFVHKAKDDRREESLHRNVEILENQIKDEEEDPDPRTFFYLAGTYMDLGRYAEAIILYEDYVKLSGWDEERQVAWLQMGRMHQELGRKDKAKSCFLQALGENPTNPEPYVELGTIDLEENAPLKAVVWLELAVIQRPKDNTITFNPLYRTYRPYMLLAQANLDIGGDEVEKALKWGEKALEVRQDPATKEFVDSIKYVIESKQVIKDALKAADDAETPSEALRALESLPHEYQDNPAVLRAYRRYTKPKKWNKKSLVIYTGAPAIGEWGPWSLREGVGGSEEAIIRLTRQFVEKGWEVVVYANPGKDAGEYSGVIWKNYWEIDMRDTFNVFVGWRNPWVFDAKIKAKKKYLWLHDVMPLEEFTEERLANLDKVMLLSNYHREIFPVIPDDKVFLSANGIDPEDFEVEGIERDPHKMIYTSSHVRGLNHLLDIWEEVKERVPDATLDIFYGWHSYDKINSNNPERMAWKSQMVELINKLDGVTDHGKVDQDRIVRETLSAGVWAYPTLFTEIFCITATKCQAGGATPVINDLAALKETARYGDILSFEEWTPEVREIYKEALIHRLENPMSEREREEMMKWARDNWSWEAVADQWIKEFESGRVPAKVSKTPKEKS